MASGFKRSNPGCACCTSSPGHTLPGCPCTGIPDAIYFHVERQPPGHVESVVFPDTLTFGARPGELSIYRSDNPGFYGSTDFVSSDFFYKFRYWFGCSGGSYFIGGLLTPDSPLGYPGFFLVATWLVGVPGNTCTPFSLASPGAATPTFQAQGISIDGTAPPPPPAAFPAPRADAFRFFFFPRRT